DDGVALDADDAAGVEQRLHYLVDAAAGLQHAAPALLNLRCGDAAGLGWVLAIPGLLIRRGGRFPALARRALGRLRRRGRRLRLGCGVQLIDRLDEGDLQRKLRLPAGALVVGRLVEAAQRLQQGAPRELLGVLLDKDKLILGDSRRCKLRAAGLHEHHEAQVVDHLPGELAWVGAFLQRTVDDI